MTTFRAALFGGRIVLFSLAYLGVEEAVMIPAELVKALLVEGDDGTASWHVGDVSG
jgi:hypothetical protein